MTAPDTDTLLDVLIVGAGLSGIGAARHLQRCCPGRRRAIVEARQTLGGTWSPVRDPGIPSDSAVTMLQRPPSDVVRRPSVDAVAQRLNRWLPASLACSLTRWKNVLVGRFGQLDDGMLPLRRAGAPA